MRVFWSLIAVLVIATAGLVISRRLDSAPARAPNPIQIAQAQSTPNPAPAQPAAPPIVPAVAPRQPDHATTPDPSPTPPPVQPTPVPQPGPAPQPDPDPAPQPEPSPSDQPAAAPAQPEPPAQPTTTPPADQPAPANLAESKAAPTPDDSKVTETAKPATDSPAADSTAATPPATIVTPGATPNPRARPTATPEVIAAAESTKGPPTLTKQADGTTLVAERFVIKGDGSKESPYEVTWEQLMSAQETYKPRLGLKIIPGWLNLIHDKWVKVSGYVAFPVMAQGPDEMLMMLNQWDGCCIGVPPTPYDAVEVKLAKPAEGETRLLIMGTVTGKLKVDPYLVKDWLVSLYIMDEAEVTKQSGAPMRESEVQQEHLAP